MSVKKRVEIRPHQRAHYTKLVNILSNEFGYIDNSDTGTGKTPLTFAVIQTFDNSLFGVAPKSTLSNWKNFAKEYGVRVEKIISYASLQGTIEKAPNHKYLTRKENKFYPTEAFKTAVRNGLLLVFDECQNIKNDNAQFGAAFALAKCVIDMTKSGESTKSGIAMLSATPIDKKENTISILKMLGVIACDTLVDKRGELLGLQQVIDYAETIDKETTDYITSQPVNKISANDICLDLYANVIKKRLSSALPPIVANKDAKNGYYDFPEKDLVLLERGVQMLSCLCTSFKKSNAKRKGGSSGKDENITSALILIERSKTATMVRLAKEQLERDPNCKVLLYFKYLENIYMATKLLRKYSPLTIVGASTEQERSSDRAKFQANNNKYRVLISNPQVSGVGVELDDKFGGHERWLYMIPNYYFMDSHQTAGRICRSGSKSVGHIRFVYSKKFPVETSILNSMMRKNKVVRAVIDDPDCTITLPGEYGIEIEGVSDFESVKHDAEYQIYLQLWQES